MLEPAKIEHLRECPGGKRIGRCPACAEQGGDHKAEHLVIYDDGRYGCVVYPGNQGSDHRRRIRVLVGIKNKSRRRPVVRPRPVEIRKP